MKPTTVASSSANFSEYLLDVSLQAGNSGTRLYWESLLTIALFILSILVLM